MKIILLKDVRSRKRGNRRLGNVGDIVEVKNGFGFFLIKEKVARFATPEASAEVAAISAELKKQSDEELRAAQVQGEKLAGLTVQISQKAGVGGVLFGAVTKDMIADALKKQGFEIKKAQVEIFDGPFKRLGDYKAQVELHADVLADINVSVVGEQLS